MSDPSTTPDPDHFSHHEATFFPSRHPRQNHQSDCTCAAGCTCAPPLNDLAIVAIVTAFVFWPVGLFTSLAARREIRRSNQRGEHLAILALLVSALSGLFWTLVILAAVSGSFLHVSRGFTPCPRYCITSPYNYPSVINPGGPMIPAPFDSVSTSTTTPPPMQTPTTPSSTSAPIGPVPAA
jgi:hypothetical protein